MNCLLDYWIRPIYPKKKREGLDLLFVVRCFFFRLIIDDGTCVS